MNQMTTGASNDFERATEIARDMVTRYGMSDELGPMVYAENEGEVFLGRSVTTHEERVRSDDAEGRQRDPQDHRRAVRRRAQADRGQPRQGRGDGQGAARAARRSTPTRSTTSWRASRRGRRSRRSRAAARRRQARRSVRRRRRGAAGGGRAPNSAAPSPMRRASMTATRRQCPYLAGRGVGAPARLRAPCIRRFPACVAAPSLDLARPRVMGILNVTPDSFSDGGQLRDRASGARARAAHGRPRAPTSSTSAASRRGPARRRWPRTRSSRASCRVTARSCVAAGVVVSVDTMKPAVMRAALAAGAAMVNDVRALQPPGALEAVGGERRRGVPDAHAGRAADDAARAAATPTSSPRSRLSRRARAGVRGRRHRARPHRDRPRLRLRQDAGA